MKQHARAECCSRARARARERERERERAPMQYSLPPGARRRAVRRALYPRKVPSSSAFLGGASIFAISFSRISPFSSPSLYMG